MKSLRFTRVLMVLFGMMLGLVVFAGPAMAAPNGGTGGGTGGSGATSGGAVGIAGAGAAATTGAGAASGSAGAAAGASGSSGPSLGAIANSNIDTTTAETSSVFGSTGANSGLRAVLAGLNLAPDPTVNAPAGTSDWFTFRYAQFLHIGLWVMMPLIMISIIHAVAKGSLQMLIKTVLINMPIAILGSVVAIEIVQLLLDATNELCTAFATEKGNDIGSFFSTLVAGWPKTTTGVGAFVLADILGWLLMFTGVIMLLILMLREASVYLATMFLPIGFAMLVWPATSRWLRRLIEFLFAIIFSKLVMYMVLALGVAGIATVGGYTPATDVTTQPNGATITETTSSNNAGVIDSNTAGWFSQATAAVLFLGIAGWSPAMVMAIVGNVAVGGEMMMHLQTGVTLPSMSGGFNAYDRARAMRSSTRGIRTGLRNLRR